eukprot:403344828
MTSSSLSLSVTNSTTTTTTHGWSEEGGVTQTFTYRVGNTQFFEKTIASGSTGKSTTTSETITYTASPETIIVPPHSKATVTATLEKLTLAGEYEISEEIPGVADAVGAKFISNKDIKTIENLKTTIPVYDTFAKAQDLPKQFNTFIKLMPDTKTVLAISRGTFSGKVGTDFKVTVTINPIDGYPGKNYSYTLPVTPKLLKALPQVRQQLIQPQTINNHLIRVIPKQSSQLSGAKQ